MLTWLLLACTSEPDDPAKEPADSDPPETDVDSDPADTDLPPLSCPEGLPGALLTTSGCLTGTPWAHGEAFLGIPYAEPPTDDLRFRRPVPHTPWTTPLAASTLGAPCPQTNGTVDGELGPGDGQEDCLTLNVWRPAGAADLPILFFVHGGGHVDGSGGQAAYTDNPGLARQAVVVTHNYRLGPLGFLATPELSAEDPQGVSGNQGLRDTLLALRWVHDNAATLGGDPDRILLFGESAGGVSTCALWLSDEADGLFNAALTQSAPCTAVNRSLDRSTPLVESGLDQGARFVDALGCTGASEDVLRCMRSRSAADILAALPGRQGLLGEGEPYFPVVDGVLIPASWADRPDDPQSVPLVAGVNADEGTLFAAGVTVAGDPQWRALLAPYALLAGTTVNELDQLYDPAVYGSYTAAFAELLGDFAFVCPTRRMLLDLSSQATVRGYFFERPYLGSQAVSAFHGAELGYVFGTLGPLAPGVDVALSEALQSVWTSLPTAPAIPGLGPWPTIDGGWLHLQEDASVALLPDLRAERCDVLDPG